MRAFKWMAVALALAAGVAQALPAMAADAWPNRPVKMVVPFPPGGPADAIARLYGQKLSGVWGQQVVIENRGGASGNIGAQAVAKAVPDGYTFLLHANSQVLNALLFKDPGYDNDKEFVPISELADYKLVVVVHPSVPYKSFQELVAAAKAKPGTITYASAGGAGAPTHLAVKMFEQMAGVEFLHVPYEGAAPATTDLLAGHVMMMFHNPLSTLQHVRSGKLRGLAVASLTRIPLAPDLPTVAELGYPGYEAGTWFGVWGPAGLASEIVAKASADMAKVSQMKDVVDQLGAQGLTAIGSSPAAFAKFQKDEKERWGKVIRTAKITVD